MKWVLFLLLSRKAQVLEAKRNDVDFKENIEALSRVLNISSKAEVNGEIQATLFENDFEQQLYEKYLSVNVHCMNSYHRKNTMNYLFQ